ncbi:MAG: hypothetical protein ACI9R3_003178 [Verrucomicrobiales bacterium]|jgi:hypothetical protein
MQRFFLFLVSLALSIESRADADADAPRTFASYAEPGFPWFASVVDATDADETNKGTNLTVRGLLLRPGENIYACFDTDLLRMSAVWKGAPDGQFLQMTGIATLSYDVDFRKAPGGQDNLPKIIGDFLFGNAVEPGWLVRESGKPIDFSDPRASAPALDEPGRGPLPQSLGRFDGIRMIKGNPGCQLEYTVADAHVKERVYASPDGILRKFEIEPHTSEIVLVVSNSANVSVASDIPVSHRAGRHLVSVAANRQSFTFYVNATTGATEELADTSTDITAPLRWEETVSTGGTLSQDTHSPYVVDELELPMPNASMRKVRLTGIDFFADGRAALVTLDGDVWILSNINAALKDLQWRRIASGLHEPQSIRVRDGELFVFDKNGLQRLVDTNGDGEIDFYHTFCNAFGQTAETREYPNDFVVKPDGGFYLAKGGQVLTRLGQHNGAIIEVSADGASAEVYARGLRQPFIGIHPQSGMLTASDQQGHFIPSSPVHWIRKGGYYGFDESIADPDNAPPITPPLTWIPHEVCQSGAGHVWMDAEKFGPMSGSLVHLAFHHPSAHRVYLDLEGVAEDIAKNPPQAAVIPLGVEFTVPVLKGAVNPVDGQLYVCGSQVWGSSSTRVSGLQRLRYNPQAACHLPSDVQVTDAGVLLHFPFELAPSADPLDILARRWNYVRTSGYGSGHYKLDGSAGEEVLAVAGVVFSDDRRSVLIRLLDMQKSMQLAISYSLRTADGKRFADSAYMTPQRLHAFDAEAMGFLPLPEITVEQLAATSTVTRHNKTMKPTVDYGKLLATQYGCIGCHSVDGSMEGKKGPSWKDLSGSKRELTTGNTVTVDRSYLAESILNPTAKIAAGFDTTETGMPPYKGILTEIQLESLLLYFESLSTQ